MAAEYRAQLMREIQGIEREFGNYTPMRFDMGLLNDQTLSDNALFYIAKLWRDSVDRNYTTQLQMRGVDENHKEKYLVMFRDGDGAFKVIDRYNHGKVEAVIRPRPDSLEYIGTDKSIEDIGGRGKFSQIIKMAEDLDVLRDHPFKPKPQ